jgi:YidC/Oxa1 family membrane protein insertase
MPRKPNTPLRVAVPLIALLGAIAVAISVGVNSSRQNSLTTDPAATQAESEGPTLTPEQIAAAGNADAPADAPAPSDDATPPGDDLAAAAAADAGSAADQTIDAATDQLDSALAAGTQTDADPKADPAPDATGDPTSDITGLVARRQADPNAPLLPLGALDDASDFEGAIEFSPRGAGIASLKLTHYFKTIEHNEHVELQAERFALIEGDRRRYAVPFALLGLFVGDTYVDLATPGIWRQDTSDPGRFTAVIENAGADPVIRVERRFEYAPGSFDLELRQSAINLTDTPLKIRWVQTGPADMAKPESKYGGDKRRVRFGYLLNPERQMGSTVVTADAELAARSKILGKRSETNAYPVEAPLWPTADAIQNAHRLVWLAFTNRYFAVAAHPIVDPASTVPEARLFDPGAAIDRLILNPFAERDDTIVVTRFTSSQQALAPQGATRSDLGIFAGPLLAPVIAADPLAGRLNLQGLVVYNYGGFCGELCTFGWLTHILLAALRFFESITGDWAAAIVVLVICVRGLLHPITRFSQIRVRRFGVQMQNAAPKMKKVQERYKVLDSDSPDERKRKQQKLQQETAKLWKEEGINPANMLGCLPMLLQSPIWIALWASLYFAAELRHEPAFWGVFQALSGGEWKFLGDLASPDKALPLGPLSFTPPFISNIYGRIESINLLPIVMGIVFYIQQKYLTPPSTSTLSPEQEQMQKTMRIMFPLMMPLFMYTAPSGLTVYFITNSTLGILEYKWIYHEAEKKGLLDPDKIKEERANKKARSGGKPGFIERLRAAAEEQQRAREQGQPRPGKRTVRNTAPPKKDPPKRYKKRG